jgi:putative membrane protein
MTFIDFFIEHIASKYDFWYWENNQIPIQNYVAWFLISIGLNLLFQKTLIKSSNYTAKGFYIIQVLFFVILNTV